MQPGKSQLSESLKVYLNNTKRLQPVIGLGSIIECVAAGTTNREPLYLCTVCVCQCGKADIRNHIFGSQHRFNYIKTWHPHLVHSWQQESNLFEKAWPLMELAKTVEAKEGTGEAKLLEIEAAAFQMMTTLSESDAETLIYILRDKQTDSVSSPDTTSLHYPVESQRIVLQNQQRSSQECVTDDITSEFDDHQTSHELAEVSQNSCSGDDTEKTPVIVEYRSEDGCSNCFLCHCCRIRSNSEDVGDHLTSSTHRLNSLTQTHFELEDTSAEMKNSCEFLQTLSSRVNQQEDRGDLKVVTVPESLCRQLAAKSYNWCVKMLCTEWTPANFPEKKVTLKVPEATETAFQGVSEEYAAKFSRKTKRRGKRKKAKASPVTVFTVSLPLTEGAVLLERRTSFRPSFSCKLPPSGLDLSHSSQSQIPDCGSGSLTGDHYDHDFSETSHSLEALSGEAADADVCTPKKNLSITFFEDATHCPGEDLYFNQCEHGAGTEDYEKRASNEQQSSQELSGEQWENQDPLEVSPAASHTRDWTSFHTQEQHMEYQCYGSIQGSTTEAKVGAPRRETYTNMSSSATRHYDQQHYHSQYMAGQYSSPPEGGLWGLHHSLPCFDVSTTNMRTRSVAHCSRALSEPGVHPLYTEQRVQSYQEVAVDHVHAAPHSHWTQLAAGDYHSGPAGWGRTFYPSYDAFQNKP